MNICEFCGVSCITKYKLSDHQNTERCKFIQNKLRCDNLELNNLKNEYENKIHEYERKIKTLKYELKNTLAMSDEYKKIIEKIIITNSKTYNKNRPIINFID